MYDMNEKFLLFLMFILDVDIKSTENAYFNILEPQLIVKWRES